MMRKAGSREIEATLSKSDLHQEWERLYGTSENECFYEQAFDHIARILGAPRDSLILDAGCGPGFHSMRLAKRGFRVEAVDFSEFILRQAIANIEKAGLRSAITVRRQNILSLSFDNETFDCVMCWGVLMHIPDIETALSELTRVLKPGGFLIISEGNMFSLQSLLMRGAKRLLGKRTADVRRSDPGTEFWTPTSASTFFHRHANVGWLIHKLEANGFVLRKRLAGQFTELYARFSNCLLRRLIHGYNSFWFSHVGIPHPAFGNIIILQRRHAVPGV